jgi:hypothetical protein
MAPNTNTSMVNHRSCVLMGVISPYPTVVIVVSAQYRDVEYCTNRTTPPPLPPTNPVSPPVPKKPTARFGTGCLPGRSVRAHLAGLLRGDETADAVCKGLLRRAPKEQGERWQWTVERRKYLGPDSLVGYPEEARPTVVALLSQREREERAGHPVGQQDEATYLHTHSHQYRRLL